MKAFGAALVAIAILYVFDSQYNDGRYTQVLQQAVTSLLPRPAYRGTGVEGCSPSPPCNGNLPVTESSCAPA